MQFDYTFLRNKMKKERYSVTALAKELGLSRVSLSSKLHSHSNFSQAQISKISKILDLSPKEIKESFFTVEVKKNNTNL